LPGKKKRKMEGNLKVSRRQGLTGHNPQDEKVIVFQRGLQNLGSLTSRGKRTVDPSQNGAIKFTGAKKKRLKDQVLELKKQAKLCALVTFSRVEYQSTKKGEW